jgi:hypothetical protein
MNEKQRYSGEAYFTVRVDFEVELSEQEFNNGKWFEICSKQAHEELPIAFKNTDFYDVEIEADSLELLEDE